MAPLVGARSDIRKRKQSMLAKARQLSLEGVAVIGRAIDNRHGATRNTDEFVVFVADLDVPNMSRAPLVDGSCNGGKLTIALGSQVIGIDLQAKGHLFICVDIQNSTK